MAQASGFIERHGLWTDDQRRLAKALAARVEKEKLKLFRVAWADPHGASRAKAVTLPAFLDALDERLQHQRRHHDARFRPARAPSRRSRAAAAWASTR